LEIGAVKIFWLRHWLAVPCGLQLTNTVAKVD